MIDLVCTYNKMIEKPALRCGEVCDVCRMPGDGIWTVAGATMTRDIGPFKKSDQVPLLRLTIYTYGWDPEDIQSEWYLEELDLYTDKKLRGCKVDLIAAEEANNEG